MHVPVRGRSSSKRLALSDGAHLSPATSPNNAGCSCHGNTQVANEGGCEELAEVGGLADDSHTSAPE